MEKSGRKMLAVLFAACILFALAPFSATAWSVSDTFLYYDESAGSFETKGLPADAFSIGAIGDQDWLGSYQTDTWYVLDCDYIHHDRSLETRGNVHLILLDGYTMEVSSIRVDHMNSIRIYAQEQGTGTLTADNSWHYYAENMGNAGIGGSAYGSDESVRRYYTGDIAIYGGHITAVGGPQAAGIGGAGNTHDENMSAGNIIIRGGVIDAAGGTGFSGGTGAGIGGGFNGNAKDIIISGGTVHARSCARVTHECAAAIGCGGDGYFGGSFGNIVISGGEITAESSGYAAAIGGGYETDRGDRKITITGGVIHASADVNRIGTGTEIAAGIGGGYGSSGITVRISGGETVVTSVGAANCAVGIPNGSADITVDGRMTCWVGSDPDSLTACYDPGRFAAVLSGNKAARVDNIRGVAYIDKKGAAKGHEGCLQLANATSRNGLCNWNTGNNPGGWYTVSGSLTLPDTAEVTGNITLILEDGCQLNAPRGIRIGPDSSLTVYGQSAQSGKLIAVLNDSPAIVVEDRASLTVNGGELRAESQNDRNQVENPVNQATGILLKNTGAHCTVNRGRVFAKGGAYGAGIGGDFTADSSSGITVCGGDVRAIGGGAGIGGTAEHPGVNITVSGGTVDASSSGSGAGIGGGNKCGGYHIVISGGTVHAAGGNLGAGIGGGNGGVGQDIRVSGGKVTATAGENGAGIGGGAGGTGSHITVDGGTVEATGKGNGAGIGGGLCVRKNSVYGNADHIRISGGSVTARGCNGIGGGGKGGKAEHITIEGGRVYAYGNESLGVGIGCVSAGKAGDIRVTGGRVKACGSSGFGCSIENFRIDLSCTLQVGHSENEAFSSPAVAKDAELYRKLPARNRCVLINWNENGRGGDDPVPKTGDGSDPALWCLWGILALAGLMYTASAKKKSSGRG